MKVRKPCLPPGWYPRDPEKIAGFLHKFVSGGGKTGNAAPACPEPELAKAARARAVPAARIAAAPHAGWYYSGAIAARAAAALTDFSGAEDRDGTLAVLGGHLPRTMPPLFAMEDAVETPLGDMVIDTELRDLLQAETGGEPDRWQDNTVEVLLPMVRYFFPRARLLWLRLPAEISSFEIGKTLIRVAASLQRELRVLGSTDLTHYGPNYDFCPQGLGQNALDWVRTVNDQRFIDAVGAGDPELVLKRAEEEKSACSAGAVLGCLGAASALRPAGSGEGAGKGGVLLEYGTSAAAAGEGSVPGSFVGYGAFSFV
ncbi:MAG: AmmeMemoRadiSam system protein B [Spirochaetaceae bacterium]|jgi:AmmeMemoRadiSam system protein B|nr:AmmeMemoRadiSam system protein B [Spirochaetaceae bacterium]